jgi:hypothetical protein
MENATECDTRIVGMSIDTRLPRLFLALLAAGALALGLACRDDVPPASQAIATVEATPEDVTADAGPEIPTIVVAPSVKGIDEALIRDAFRRVVEKGQQDYGLLPTRPVTIYIDPDNAIGLEDALGLSQKSAIHLRAGHARSASRLLPLLMHEYTHALQFQQARLRPQWWVEGQADYQALRIQDLGTAERQRRSLYGQLADDVRKNRAPSLSELRAGIGWDDYVKKAGAGKAYGWGSAAVAFIESRAGFDGVRRVMLDQQGQNTLSRFDAVVQEVTGLAPADFDTALKQWVVQQANG